MTRQELEKMTCNQLAEICKSNGITYYNGKTRIKKDQMIEKILACNEIKNEVKAIVEKQEDDLKDTKSIDSNEGKKRYIESIEIGVLVAFREPESGKLNTAKVMNKSTKNRKLKLQTNYGKEFVISFDSVVWVRTGTRWPRGIYNELKGIKNESDR